MIVRNLKTLEEKVLDVWADHVGGQWWHVIGSGKDFVHLEAPGESFFYDNTKEAAEACLATIGEWLKEV